MANDIHDMFKDALTNMDFKRLNNEITTSVNAALAEVRSALGILAEGDKLKGNIPKPGTWRPAEQEKTAEPVRLQKNKSQFFQKAEQRMPQAEKTARQGNPAMGKDMHKKPQPAAMPQRMGRNQPQRPSGWKNWNQTPPASISQADQPGRVLKRGLQIPFVPRGRTFGTVAVWTGTSLFAGISVAMITFASFYAISAGTATAFWEIMMQAFFLPWVVSFLVLRRGRKLQNRNRRAKIYLEQLRYRGASTIKELAGAIGESERYVLRDIKMMLSMGMFPGGHLVQNETILIGTRDVYEQYTLTMNGNEQKLLEDNRRLLEEQDRLLRQNSALKDRYEKQIPVPEDPYSGLSPEVREAIISGRELMNQIKEANAAIEGEEMSTKLDRLELVVDRILYHVEKYPKKLPEIRKFMDYYLPTTLKLVITYQEFHAQPVQGENILTAKDEIMKTLDTINYAFEKLLDSMFEEAAMDVSTDISVLETMFAQEGLTEDDFTVGKEVSDGNVFSDTV